MRTVALAILGCFVHGCSAPEWSAEPGIALCEDVASTCEDAYSEGFERCAEELALDSGLEERRNTAECSVPRPVEGQYDGVGAKAVATAHAAAARDDLDFCGSELRRANCWR